MLLEGLMQIVNKNINEIKEYENNPRNKMQWNMSQNQ